MPLTTLMTLLGGLSMLGSWFLVGQRIAASSRSISPQVRYLRSFFLFMGIFCSIMFLPHLLLGVRNDLFPFAMAWGYIIGHLFLYAALIQVIRLTFSMLPRYGKRENFAIIMAISVGIFITIMNIGTMAYGTQPYHDFEKHVTFFNAAPVVGASIALFAAVSVFPAALLLIVNGVRSPGRRLRSFLLGGGLFVLMAAGPIHDNAKNWQLYMVADILSIVGLFIITAGVLYRLEERISPKRSRSTATATH